jgi:toxin YhaV
MAEPDDDSFDKVNGWTLYIHPLFVNQVEELMATVAKQKKDKPRDYQKSTSFKHLAAIKKLVLDAIPANPAKEEFRQGKTLGSSYTNWRRGKFFQQYRLFFLYKSSTMEIIYAWVNGEDTKRARGNKDDTYSVFRSMLDVGNPPSDYDSLLKEAKRASLRMRGLLKPTPTPSGTTTQRDLHD